MRKPIATALAALAAMGLSAAQANPPATPADHHDGKDDHADKDHHDQGKKDGGHDDHHQDDHAEKEAHPK